MTTTQYVALVKLNIPRVEWPDTITVTLLNDPVYTQVIIVNRYQEDPLLHKESENESPMHGERMTWDEVDDIIRRFNDKEKASGASQKAGGKSVNYSTDKYAESPFYKGINSFLKRLNQLLLPELSLSLQ